ncbi:MAG TPA: ABC transporter substrate-binding protein [Clostridiaceae bacterium]|nr:ABC transporter substrate-binding protein [Clostridiaceae bacterium]
MKKLLSVLLITVLLSIAVAGCGNVTDTPKTQTPAPSPTNEATPSPESEEPEYEPIDMRIAGMTGPTSMGMAKLMESAEAGTAKNNYIFSIVGSADEITPKLIKGDLDIAAVPANLAAVLYNNTEKKIKLLAVNTLGVLYIVEKGNELESLADLRGKTIYATGKGSVPEYNLRYLLTQNGIDPDKDITIEWKSEPNEVVALLKNSESGVAMLPQPYVTIARSQVEGLRTAVDLTEEWDKLDNGSSLITGVVIARSDFVDNNPEQVAAFLDEYRLSVEYVNANVDEAAQLIEKFGIFKAAVAKQALPYCNITFIEGEDMKTAVSGYLSVLYEQNPKSVGGTLPDEGFYFAR